MRVFTRRDNFSLDFSFPARTRAIEFSKRILLCKFLYKGDNRPVDPVKIATVVTNISRKGYFPFQKSSLLDVSTTTRDLATVSAAAVVH